MNAWESIFRGRRAVSSKATVTVVYDGPAIDGTMNVYELAPALLEMGRMVECANLELNGEGSRANLLVKGDFRKGSFPVDLEVVQDFFDGAKEVLDLHRAGVDARTLAEMLGLCSGGMGLLRFIKWLKGRAIAERAPTEDGKVQITVQGDNNSVNTIEVHGDVVRLADNDQVRQATYGILKPLETPGIDRFIVRENEQDIEVIGKDERPYFALPSLTDTNDDEITNEFTAYCPIVTLQFPEGKWKLGLGDNKIWASIDDSEFNERVASAQESFASGDTLEVRMRMVQSKSTGKIEYSVIKVLDHRQASALGQSNLFPGPDNETDV